MASTGISCLPDHEAPFHGLDSPPTAASSTPENTPWGSLLKPTFLGSEAHLQMPEGRTNHVTCGPGAIPSVELCVQSGHEQHRVEDGAFRAQSPVTARVTCPGASLPEGSAHCTPGSGIINPASLVVIPDAFPASLPSVNQGLNSPSCGSLHLVHTSVPTATPHSAVITSTWGLPPGLPAPAGTAGNHCVQISW